MLSEISQTKCTPHMVQFVSNVHSDKFIETESELVFVRAQGKQGVTTNGHGISVPADGNILESNSGDDYSVCEYTKNN